MKAIYGRKLYTVSKDTGDGVELASLDEDNPNELFYVGYDNPGLIIDPTDGEIEFDTDPFEDPD